jgi:hypothetical protein
MTLCLTEGNVVGAWSGFDRRERRYGHSLAPRGANHSQLSERSELANGHDLTFRLSCVWKAICPFFPSSRCTSPVIFTLPVSHQTLRDHLGN